MTKVIFLCIFAVSGQLIYAEPPGIAVITKARDNDTLISISSSDRKSIMSFSYPGGIKDIKMGVCQCIIVTDRIKTPKVILYARPERKK